MQTHSNTAVSCSPWGLARSRWALGRLGFSPWYPWAGEVKDTSEGTRVKAPQGRQDPGAGGRCRAGVGGGSRPSPPPGGGGEERPGRAGPPSRDAAGPCPPGPSSRGSARTKGRSGRRREEEGRRPRWGDKRLSEDPPRPPVPHVRALSAARHGPPTAARSCRLAGRRSAALRARRARPPTQTGESGPPAACLRVPAARRCCPDGRISGQILR